MSDITLNTLTANDYAVTFQGVRELKKNLSIQEAADSTQKNGLDEVFFEAGGRHFVAYSQDAMDLVNFKKGSDFHYLGKPVKVLHLNDETNSFLGGVQDMVSLIGKTALKPLQQLQPYLPNASTAIAFAGGVALGAFTRTSDISLATRIGLGLGTAGGVGIVQAVTDHDSSVQKKAAKAAATGIASVALGVLSPEIVKLAAKIPIPDVVSKSAKVVGVTALTAGAIALIGGGIAGATKKVDLKTIGQIAR